MMDVTQKIPEATIRYAVRMNRAGGSAGQAPGPDQHEYVNDHRQGPVNDPSGNRLELVHFGSTAVGEPIAK